MAVTVTRPTPEEVRRELDLLREELRRGQRLPQDVMLMDYQTEYLDSSLWRRIRKRVLTRDGKKCVFCDGAAQTVHHRSYDRNVLEGKADQVLVSLCDACHNFIHFDMDGQRRSLEETDRILLREQPPTHFPEPIVDLRRELYRDLPAEWPRMNHIQRNGWLARYRELRKTRRAELKAKAESRAARRRPYAWDAKAPWIPLEDAVARYRKEEGAPSNSYGWYRECAKRSGVVHIGDSRVKAEKRNRVWHVEADGFLAAISSHRERFARIARMTADYSNGAIHGKDGERIETTWGHYSIRGKFRFVFSLHDYRRGRSDGTWLCNSCRQPASLKGQDESTLFCEKCNHGG
jgi:5-methylcytosine-specific restriction endonuclease McrA